MAFFRVKKTLASTGSSITSINYFFPFFYSSEDQFNPPPQSYLKRHSTGDAMELLSNLRSQPKFQEPNSSTGSLGSATGSHNKGGAAGNSATSITDF